MVRVKAGKPNSTNLLRAIVWLLSTDDPPTPILQFSAPGVMAKSLRAESQDYM